MTPPLILLVALLTSAAVVGIALARGRGSLAGFRRAVREAVETVGAVAIFMALNVAAGMFLVLAARKLTPYYFSLWEIADVALLVLSLFQALVYQTWRRRRM